MGKHEKGHRGIETVLGRVSNEGKTKRVKQGQKTIIQLGLVQNDFEA